MAPRISATDKMRRLLALVPWIASHPDGAPIDETCQRFGLTRAQLLDDFSIVPFVGVYPYSPDELIEVDVRDDRIFVSYNALFRRSLRLTPEEGLALVAAGTALLATPGADPDGPLARGLDKLAAVLGVRPGDDLGVELGPGVEALLATVHQALVGGLRLEIRYYSHGRDSETTRVVDPWQLWSHAGHWYLGGYCHLAGGERVFRVDRIAEATVLDEPSTPPSGDQGANFLVLDELPRVTLDLSPRARWLLDSVPLVSSTDLADGGTRVTLGIGATPWLDRLLLQLGPDATIVEIDDRLGDAHRTARAAQRILARYDR